VTPQPHNRTSLSVEPDQADWSPPQTALLTELIRDWHECPPAQRQRFLHAVQASGLDPFLRQIFTARDRDGVWYIQAHIEGLRLAAQRAAAKAGETYEYEDPTWVGEDGSEHPRVWIGSSKHPYAVLAAVVKIRGEIRARIPCDAYWAEYCPSHIDRETGELFEDEFWIKHPVMRLGQVCEAAGLRKAYPGALSAILHPAEVEAAAHAANDRLAHDALQAGAAEAGALLAEQAAAAVAQQDGPAERDLPQTAGPAVSEIVAGLLAEADAAGLGGRMRASMRQVYGTDDPTEVTGAQADELAAQVRTALATVPASRGRTGRRGSTPPVPFGRPRETAAGTSTGEPGDSSGADGSDGGTAKPPVQAKRRPRTRKASTAAPADGAK
jgi:hypothetical protein